MKSMRTFIVLAVLVYCVESRARVKIMHDGNRQFRAIQGNPSEVVPQAVVVDTIDGSKQEEQVSGPSQPQQFQVPLSERQPEEQFRAGQQGYQQAQQVQQYPQPQQQVPYQPQPQYQQQFAQQQPQQQFAQPQPQQQFQPQQVYQPQPQLPFVPQQAQQITYQPQQQLLAGVPSNVVKQVMQTTPANAQLFDARVTLGAGGSYPIGGAGGPVADLIHKLPSNSTRIRPNIVDGFSCQGRKYGYYADTLNECQIFHVCFPLKDVFNNNPAVPDATYQFSFICNDFTRFSQDSLTCAWQYEAIPCEEAQALYDVVNANFFKIPPPKPTEVTLGGYPPRT